MLRVFEAALRDQGVPIDDWSNPGLSADEIVRVVEPLGLRLPDEARVWWEWRDGASPGGRDRVFGPGKNCLSVEAAVAQYRQSRSVAEKSIEPDLPPLDDPDFLWNPAWLPIVGPGLLIVLDCSASEPSGPVPVRFIDWQAQPEEFAQVQARSFGEMVGWWLRALETGAWRWRRSEQEWDVDHQRLDEHFRMSPLV
jgi:cell wall assembly regulator SMI1